MGIFKKKIFKKNEINEEDTLFDKNNKVEPLKMFISIVPRGQAPAIVKIFEEYGSSYSYITSAVGTGKNYLPGLLSAADAKKQVVFTFIREDKSEEVCQALKNRFSVSKSSSGISLSIKLTSVAGISVYRFLTNTRKVKKVDSYDDF